MKRHCWQIVEASIEQDSNAVAELSEVGGITPTDISDLLEAHLKAYSLSKSERNSQRCYS